LTQAVLSSVDEQRVIDQNRPYIFRAHVTTTSNTTNSKDRPAFLADIYKEELKWDTSYHRVLSLDQFAIILGKHLMKVKEKYDSCFYIQQPRLG
jgi:hypothetical protein